MPIDLNMLNLIGKLNGLALLSKEAANFTPISKYHPGSPSIVYDDTVPPVDFDGDFGYPICESIGVDPEDNNKFSVRDHLTDAIDDLEAAYVVKPGPSTPRDKPYMHLTFKQLVFKNNKPVITIRETIIIDDGYWFTAN